MVPVSPIRFTVATIIRTVRVLGRLRARPPYWPTEGYLVGGAVRDLWFGRTPRDLDFLVPDPAGEAERAAHRLQGNAFPLRGGIFRVVAGERVLDFASLQKGGLAADLARRDFTVNALAMNRRGAVIGPTVARADLRARRIRAQRPQVFEEDPLRSLRAVRLWTTHGLRPEPRTWKWITDHARRLRFGKKPAWERVREELAKILESPRAAFGMAALERSGLLAAYLPELAAGVGLFQGGYHHADLWRHTLEALDFLVHHHPEAGLELRLAVLLHDVAKPLVRQWDEERGYWRFFYHDEDGAELAQAILRRLKSPKAEARRVAGWIRLHMRRPPGNRRGLRRWVFEHRTWLPELLWLQVADVAATRGPRAAPGAWQKLARVEPEVRRFLRSLPTRPLLSGHEVAALLGRAPGPWLGRLLRDLLAAQAEGRVSSQEEAKVFVLWWYEAKAPNARRSAEP